VRLTREDVIAGVPAVWLRDVLRRCGPRFRTSVFAGDAQMTPRKATNLLQALASDGYLDRVGPDWQMTIRAGALCRAQTRKPFSRAVAQRHLDGFLERVHQANASPDWVWWVEEVALFGSFLDAELDPVSDVDVVLRLTPRYEGDEFREKAQQFTWAAIQNGRTFPNFSHRVMWPKTALVRFLRGNATAIELTEEHDGVLQLVTPRVVYFRSDQG